MSTEIFDPSTSPEREAIDYVPRPKELSGLRIGLVENTKFNSDKLLLKIAHLLKERHGMEMVMLNSKKSASAFVEEEAIRDFKTKADFVLAGVGD